MPSALYKNVNFRGVHASLLEALTIRPSVFVNRIGNLGSAEVETLLFIMGQINSK